MLERRLSKNTQSNQNTACSENRLTDSETGTGETLLHGGGASCLMMQPMQQTDGTKRRQIRMEKQSYVSTTNAN